MQLYLNESEVVDACCVLVATRHRVIPERVNVELFYEPGMGFGAEAKVGWNKEQLNEQDMNEAVVLFLSEYHNFNTDLMDVQLQCPDESRIEAYVRVGESYARRPR